MEKFFVSAAPGTNLNRMMDNLRLNGVEVYTALDQISPGEDITEGLVSAIQEADGVIVVLGRQSAAVPAFEAGIAAALGKQVVVLAGKGVKVPTSLGQFMLVKGGPNDFEAINYALDHMKGRKFRPSKAMSDKNRTGTLGARADEMILRLTKSTISPVDFEKIMADAIKSTGVIAAEGEDEDEGFDLGIWSDELESIGANPLVVSFKMSSQPIVKDLHRQLASYSNARAALLIYWSPSNVSSKPARAPRGTPGVYPVMAIEAIDLLSQLRDSTFAEVIHRLRNRSVHGVR